MPPTVGTTIDRLLAIALAAALLDAVVSVGRDAGGALGVWFALPGATTLGVLTCGLLLALARAAWQRSPGMLRPLLAAGAGAALGAWSGVALFSGTGVRRMGLHGPLVALSLAVGVIGGALLARRRRGPAAWAVATGAVGLYLAHAGVLVRQYDALHALLAWTVATAWCSSALRDASPSGPARWPRRALALGLVVAAAVTLVRGNATRATVRRVSPLGQYAARLAGLAAPREPVAAAPRLVRPVGGPSLPLGAGDVVLVTVDALRADALRALGGRGRMPHLDELAARGLLFRRAYTATPHTSYSLASLMTGTHARSALALGARFGRSMTLAGRLREAGFTTAGWYPAAVFFVDGERFRTLASRHWDLQLVEETWDPAEVRVRSALRWAHALRRDQRGFAWLHLFEPHEPYAAHAEHPYGADARARYDAECSAVDDALHELFTGWGRPVTWVITADHGEEFGEHGGSFHGTSLYDEQARVPLVIVAPGVAPRVVSSPVSLVDLVPTLLGGVGVAAPPGVEGVDLGSLATSDRSDALAFAETGSLRMVVEGRDKLIADTADGTLERYDLAADPGEHRNLADEDPARTASLRAQILRWESAHAQAAAARSSRAESVIPASLARALQGDRVPPGELVPLLAAPDEELGARTARVLGDLGDTRPEVCDALAPLLAMSAPRCDEAAVSLALLGDERGRERATRVLVGTSDVAQKRRAALGLARWQVPEALPVLNAWATDERASDAERDRVIALLRAARSPSSRATWEALLDSPRLAPVAAEALGDLGDAASVPALLATLDRTRYPITRRAVLVALASLGAPDLGARLRAALGALDPLDDVAPLLARVREPGRAILGRRPPAARPSRRVRVALTATAPAPVERIYLQVEAQEAGSLTVDAEAPVLLRAGPQQLVVTLAGPTDLRAVDVRATTPVRITSVAAVAVVAASPAGEGGR